VEITENRENPGQETLTKEDIIAAAERKEYDPNNIPPLSPIVEQIIRHDCRYCLGRGYERWLSARIKHPDGSIKEEFEEKACRCVKVAVINAK
jgi:hypothetical protein